MLNKVTGLARALNVLLAVIAGFVAIPNLNVALVLVVLGLISGIVMSPERMLHVGVMVLVLPAIGVALANIPMIGEQLAAVAGNVALGGAGALASGIAIMLFGLVKDGVMGLAKSA